MPIIAQQVTELEEIVSFWTLEKIRSTKSKFDRQLNKTES